MVSHLLPLPIPLTPFTFPVVPVPDFSISLYSSLSPSLPPPSFSASVFCPAQRTHFSEQQAAFLLDLGGLGAQHRADGLVKDCL